MSRRIQISQKMGRLSRCTLVVSRYYIDRDDKGDLVPAKVSVLSPRAKDILKKATTQQLRTQESTPQEEEASNWTSKYNQVRTGLLDDAVDSEERFASPADFEVPVVPKKKGYSRSMLYSTPQEEPEPDEQAEDSSDRMAVVAEEDAEQDHQEDDPDN